MMKNSLTEIMKIFDGINEAKENLAHRIIMKKEIEELSYDDLLNRLHDLKPDKFSTYDASDIRKGLNAKKPDVALLEDLCYVLDIKPSDDDLSEAIIAYRYHNNKDGRKKGRISKKDKERNKESHKRICEDLILSDGNSIERAIFEGLDDNGYSYKGDPIDKATYYDLMEDEFEKDILKNILLISRVFPQEVEKFISIFEFNDDEKAELDKIDIEIKYY